MRRASHGVLPVAVARSMKAWVSGCVRNVERPPLARLGKFRCHRGRHSYARDTQTESCPEPPFDAADKRVDLFDDLVLHLKIPNHLGNIDEEKQPGQQESLHSRYSWMLQPRANADPNR